MDVKRVQYLKTAAAFCMLVPVVAGLPLSAKQAATAASAFYCEYCGHKAASVAALTAADCFRHPEGAYKGKHKLYEGSEKEQYTCKYCGIKRESIAALVNGSCYRHPGGIYKGKHVPAQN